MRRGLETGLAIAGASVLLFGGCSNGDNSGDRTRPDSVEDSGGTLYPPLEPAGDLQLTVDPTLTGDYPLYIDFMVADTTDPDNQAGSVEPGETVTGLCRPRAIEVGPLAMVLVTTTDGERGYSDLYISDGNGQQLPIYGPEAADKVAELPDCDAVPPKYLP